MDQRLYPWRDKPGDLVSARISSAQTSRLYLVQERGPTSFVVMSQDAAASTCNKKRYRVLIGSPQTCSCRDSADLCIHLLFIMIKVLRLSPDNPLVWQKALLDREIAEILSGKHSVAKKAAVKVPGMISRSEPEQEGVVQREICSDDVCSICMDTLMSDCQELTFCRSGCGNSVHQECMRVWAQYRQSIGEQVSCPLCRASDWAPLPTKSRSSRSVLSSPRGLPHRYVQCAACCGRVFGHRYTCACCDQYDLCQVCARTQIPRHEHGTGAFLVKTTAGSNFEPMSGGALVDALIGLLEPAPRSDATCAFCNQHNIQDIMVQIPCHHHVHRKCLHDRMGQDHCQVACRIDGRMVFPGLVARLPRPQQRQQSRPQQSRSAIRFGRRAPDIQTSSRLDLSLSGIAYSSR